MAIRVSASEAIAAPLEEVWAIVGSPDRDPEFWWGTTAVENLEVTATAIRRIATRAFRGQRCEEIVRLVPREAVVHEIVKGPMRGRRVLTLRPSGGGTLVQVEWVLGLRGALRLIEPFFRGHVRRGTRNALARIRAAAEARAPATGAVASGRA